MDFFRGFFGLIIPVLIICIPTIYQLVLLQKRLDNKTSLSHGMIFLWTMAMGIACPVSATFINLESYEILIKVSAKEAQNGYLLFIILGVIVAFVLTPLISIIGYVTERNNPKRKAE